ncbi:hypothetical protein Tco_0470660 [Tanacetum coccineum]
MLVIVVESCCVGVGGTAVSGVAVDSRRVVGRGEWDLWESGEEVAAWNGVFMVVELGCMGMFVGNVDHNQHQQKGDAPVNTPNYHHQYTFKHPTDLMELKEEMSAKVRMLIQGSSANSQEEQSLMRNRKESMRNSVDMTVQKIIIRRFHGQDGMMPKRYWAAIKTKFGGNVLT